MENQHRKITGYRELSAEEIALMNEIKAKGAEIAVLIDKLETMQDAEYAAFAYTGFINDQSVGPDEEHAQYKAKLEAYQSARHWTITGATDIQKGFMGLIRAVARPTTFC